MHCTFINWYKIQIIQQLYFHNQNDIENRKAMHASEKNQYHIYMYIHENYAIYHLIFTLLYFGIPVSVLTTISINSNIYILHVLSDISQFGGKNTLIICPCQRGICFIFWVVKIDRVIDLLKVISFLHKFHFPILHCLRNDKLWHEPNKQGTSVNRKFLLTYRVDRT